ncbi:GNAT family N-acetyltransferase [Aquimarina aquimarini]|uniref:GNAT family N-acetyltransferase n=1 Tax=Aquimarina aquimarini TaxID=1191734 RepID=UPI001F1E454F|nr:GNAT family N-acetyltransferase [Aquimarina aquimarini]
MRLFETKNLYVRYLKTEDQDAFYDMQSNPNVMRYIKKTMNFEESKKELDRFITYYTEDKTFYNIWAVVESETQRFIGICGVYKNKHSEYEIAYRLRECFWRKGFGQEIAKALISYCFDIMRLPELTAYVAKENVGSICILEKEMKYIEESYAQKENILEQKYKAYREY